MNTVSNRGKSVSSLFVYVLIGLFALLCVVAVLLGAGVYRSVSAGQETHNTERVLTAYVRSMVRAHAETGAVSVEKGDEGDILVLSETYDDEQLLTRLYCFEGKLCEQFTYAEDDFDPDAGETVTDAKTIAAELDDNLLHVCITAADGTLYRVDVAVPAAGEEAKGA